MHDNLTVSQQIRRIYVNYFFSKHRFFHPEVEKKIYANTIGYVFIFTPDIVCTIYD